MRVRLPLERDLETGYMNENRAKFLALALTLLALVSGGDRTPALAQSAEGLIGAGQKSIAKGNFKTAIRQLTRAMRADDLSQEQLAKAFYQRGIAYRKTGSHASSIADITRALWFKELPAADRKRALQSRGQSFKELGFSRKASADLARAGGSRGNTSGFATTVSRSAEAPASRSAAKSSSGGFFGGLFASADTSTPPQRNSTPKPVKTAPVTGLTGWGNGLTVKATPGAAAPTSTAAVAAKPPAVKKPAARAVAATSWQTVSTKTAAVAPAVRRSLPPSSAGGRFAVQIASVRSKKDAAALWQRIKKRHGGVLSRRRAYIERADLGAKGIFYRVQVHPPADRATSKALCDELKAKGTYCVLAAR